MAIKSIQVVPVKEEIIDGETYVEFQPAGPDEFTTNWSIYQRHDNGQAEWVADVNDEPFAMIFGNALAQHLGAPIEPQAWRDVAAKYSVGTRVHVNTGAAGAQLEWTGKVVTVVNQGTAWEPVWEYEVDNQPHIMMRLTPVLVWERELTSAGDA